MLAWRYLRGRRSRLLAGTARAALASTALGVAAMVVAMALMTGYTEELQSKVLGSGAIIAYPQGPVVEEQAPEEIAATLRRVAGVETATAVVFAQGSLSSAAHPQGLDVTVRGVPPGEPVIAGGLARLLGEPPPALPPSADAIPPVLLGADLASRLAADSEELLRLVVVEMGARGPGFRYHTVRFAGTFTTGFAEYDGRWVVIDRSVAAELSGTSGLYEIAVDDGAAVPEVRARVETALGDRFLVTDWEPHNRELWNALRLQKLALFLVLGLIVVVSTFNLASTLVVLVRERLKEVGLLGALGLRRRELVAVFLLCGGTLGALGTGLGVGLGSAVAWVLTTFDLIRFEADVAAIYFISSVPFRVRLADLLAVVGFSLVVTVLTCWLPARRVSRIDPAVALRYE